MQENLEDLEYINLIIKEIVDFVDMFNTKEFKNEKERIVYIAMVLTKVNLFLNLIQMSDLDDQFMVEINQILNYNLIRLIELSGYSEDELDEAMQKCF